MMLTTLSRNLMPFVHVPLRNRESKASREILSHQNRDSNHWSLIIGLKNTLTFHDFTDVL